MDDDASHHRLLPLDGARTAIIPVSTGLTVGEGTTKCGTLIGNVECTLTHVVFIGVYPPLCFWRQLLGLVAEQAGLKDSVILH